MPATNGTFVRTVLLRISTHPAIRELQRAKAVFDQFGMTAAVRKVVPYSVRFLSHQIKYLAYRRAYAQDVIFMASLAKSGSTWLANMLSELPGFSRYQPAGWTASLNDKPNEDIYPGMFEEVRRKLAIIKGHTRGTVENVDRLHTYSRKYLITVRDPRDQLISDYWYTRNRPNHPNHRIAASLDLAGFIGHQLDPLESGTQRADWIREWLRNRDPRLSLIIRYEDLLTDPCGTMQHIFDFLEIAPRGITIPQIVARHRFEQRSGGRTPGSEDTTSFLRRGVTGEWREVFTREMKVSFAAQMEDVVSALGYQSTLAPSERQQ